MGISEGEGVKDGDTIVKEHYQRKWEILDKPIYRAFHHCIKLTVGLVIFTSV